MTWESDAPYTNPSTYFLLIYLGGDKIASQFFKNPQIQNLNIPGKYEYWNFQSVFIRNVYFLQFLIILVDF